MDPINILIEKFYNKYKDLLNISNNLHLNKFLSTLFFLAVNFSSVERIPKYLFNSKFNKIEKPIIYTTKYGFKILLNPRDLGFPRELILKKGTRETIAENIVAKKILAPNKGKIIFLDIGCNYGFYSLLAAPYSKLIYAIEPNIEVLRLAELSAKINGYKNIKFYNLALGNKEGFVKFYISEQSNLSSTYYAASDSIIKEISVKMTTLDKFLENKKIPNFIKMDVEGAEYDILKGGEKTLSEDNIKWLFIELHPYILGENKLHEILEILYSNNFKLIYAIIDNKKLTALYEIFRYFNKFLFYFISKTKYKYILKYSWYEGIIPNKIINEMIYLIPGIETIFVKINT